MSVEFTLSGNSLSVPDWNELLKQWAEEQERELFSIPELEGESEPTALVWGAGSIRGVVLTWNEKDREVGMHLNALASRRDWEMGYDLMQRAVYAGGGSVTRENGEEYSAGRLTVEEAHRDAVDEFCATTGMLQGLMEKDKLESMSLPVGFFYLPCAKEELPRCTSETMPSVEKPLADRVAKYATAYPASTMVLTDNTKLGTWALIPTIVGDVDMVMIQWKNMCVPLARVKAVLGERAEPLGEKMTYLPTLDVERDQEVLLALEKECVRKDEEEPTPAEKETSEQDKAYQLIRLVAARISGDLFQGKDVADARSQFLATGLDPEFVDGLIAIVGKAMKDIFLKKKPTAEVVEYFASKGARPEHLQAILEGMAESCSEYRKD
jgi:hypothetical protein